MKRLSALIVIASSILFSTVGAYAATPMDTLVVAHKIDEMITLDPAAIFEFSALEYAANTYERLLNYDPQDPSKLYGILATSWEISSDSKKYTFKLAANRKFASGNSVTADDVVFSLQRVIALGKSPAVILAQFGLTKANVEQSIVATAPDTVMITLDKGYAPSLFLNCLTAPVASIVDKKLVEQHAVDGDFGHKWLAVNHAGSGPYQLQQWHANDHLMLTANPYFPVQPAMTKIITRHVSEAATQKLLLENGDIDIARNYSDELNGELATKFYAMSTPKNCLIYMALNQQHEKLSLPQVKQAIKYLIDYKLIEDTIYKNQAAVHQSFIPKGVLAVDDANPYDYNLAKARELLKEVGLEKGFTVTLDAKNTELAQAIQASLARANIKVDIITGDSKQILTKFRARKYELLIASWDSDYPDPHANATAFLMNADNSDNTAYKTLAWRSSWNIPELTKAAELAALETSSEQRIKMYATLQKEFLQQAPLVVMLQQKEVCLLSNRINGFRLGASSSNTDYRDVTKVF